MSEQSQTTEQSKQVLTLRIATVAGVEGIGSHQAQVYGPDGAFVTVKRSFSSFNDARVYCQSAADFSDGIVADLPDPIVRTKKTAE